MKRICLIALILTLIVILFLGMTPKTASKEKDTLDVELSSTEVITKPVTLYPELKRICSCESTGKPDREPQHFEADGVTVRYGRINPKDTGACQINLYYHEASATKLGFDLFKEEDNLRYAMWLYENEGSTPWNWSKSCWADPSKPDYSDPETSVEVGIELIIK